MAEVTVDASWRMSRVVLNAPSAPDGVVTGYAEVLLQDIESKQTFGAMPGATITRVLGDVLNEEIDIDGVKVPFSSALVVMEKFLQKWRVEDETKPPPTKLETAELTPMPPPPINAEPPNELRG